MSDSPNDEGEISNTTAGYVSPTTQGLYDGSTPNICSYWGHTDGGVFATGAPLSGRSDQPTSNGVHTGGANWLATDGHVKYLRPAQVSTGDTAVSAADYQDQQNSTATPQAPTGEEASGTSSLKLHDNTTSVVLTFSPT